MPRLRRREGRGARFLGLAGLAAVVGACDLGLPELREGDSGSGATSSGGSSSTGGVSAAGGTGGSGGSGGSSGAAGSSGGCTDTLDVPPTKVTQVFSGVTEIAALGQTFGGLAHADATTLLLAILSPSGAAVAPAILLPSVTDSLSWSGIAATQAGYYVSTKAPSDKLGVARYGTDGLAKGGVVTISSNTFPPHAVLSGAADRVLATWMQPLSLMAAVLKDGEAAASSPQVVGKSSCCARSWSVVSHSGGFGILRYDNNSPESVFYRNVDPNGVPGADKPLVALKTMQGPPYWGALLNGNLAFGHCKFIVVLSPAGDVVSTGPLPASDYSSCAVGSTGTRLRMAEPKGSSIEWRDVTPGAVGAVMLTIPTAAASLVQMAWDGTGFGLIWRDENTGDLRFARVKVCTT